MSKLVKVLKSIGYLLVAYVAVDAAWRAATGEGFSELLSPAAMDALEWAGLIKKKAAFLFNQLTESTRAAFDQFMSGQTDVFKEVISKINREDPAAVNAMAEKAAALGSEYFAGLKELPQKIREIMNGNGYVIDGANNLKLTALAAGALLLKSAHFFYKRSKHSTGNIKKNMREKTVHNLTGVFVSTDIHSEYRYHSADNPFEVGTKDAQEAKNSFAASKLKQEIEVEMDEEVQICYLVPGKASFKFDIDGKNVTGKNVGKNQFYVGLKDKRFGEPGAHNIQLSILSKNVPGVYAAKVYVT
jgi:hypothetical protein